MSKEKSLVDFSEIFSGEFTTLNVQSCLIRLDFLDEDLITLSKLIKSHEDSGEPFPYFKLEIISYYAVCCVTCLEWHARSRLRDIFTHKPDLIDLKDMQINIGMDTLSQMVRKKLMMPDYIAASVSVSSIDKYLSIFERVLKGVGSDKKSRSVLNNKSEGRTNYEFIDYMFKFRNGIVHEIGYTMIGSYSQRANIDLEEAQKMLKITRRVIQNYEDEISVCADDLFPNKLDKNYDSVDHEVAIDREILRISSDISEFLKSDSELQESYENWRAVVAAFRAFYKANEEFVDGLRLPGWRYLDPRHPLRARGRVAALEYLRSLKENF